MQQPNRSPNLRQRNREAILRYLFLHAPCSRLELSQVTGLSPGAVTNIVAELLDERVIYEQGSIESEGGRPRVLLAPNPTFCMLVGVDLGETHLQMELFDFTLRCLHQVRLPVSESHPDTDVQLIARAWRELVQATGIDSEQVLGIGIGVPGVVEHDGDIAVAAPHWHWESVKLYRLLQAYLPAPIYIDNGAKAMTLAESWFGAGRNARHLAVILIGTGVGAGIITHGELYRGATNSAGEWGHTKLLPGGRQCRCGSHGCLEAYVGAPGILRTWAEMTGTAVTNDQVAGLYALHEAWRSGDISAQRVLDTTAQYLGLGLANLANLFNPERIVLGGWVGSLLGETLLNAVRPYLTQYALPPSLRNLDICLGQLGQEAVCTGAACLVLERFFQGHKRFQKRGASGRLDNE